MARTPFLMLLLVGLLPAVLATGCASPSHTDQDALFGGLLGAGTGAVVGHAVGNTGAGAAIGAGVGAASGAAVGSQMDEVEARNQAMIAQQLGRPVGPGTVTIDEVIAMTRTGVQEDLIANHVRANRMVAPLQSGDLIRLQQESVSPRVVAAMQEPSPRPVQPVVVQPSGPAIVDGYPYYYSPGWGLHYYPHVYYQWR
jgi:hypothetical protein